MPASRTLKRRQAQVTKPSPYLTVRKTKTKPKKRGGQVWVAVKVERGFISEARVFESLAAANRIEQHWRASLNPDYDEAAVVKSQFIPCRANKLRGSR